MDQSLLLLLLLPLFKLIVQETFGKYGIPSDAKAKVSPPTVASTRHWDSIDEWIEQVIEHSEMSAGSALSTDYDLCAVDGTI